MSAKSSSSIPPSIYFGGCCFGAAFYVGVHKAMVEKWGKDFYKHCVVGGGSAGTIFAVGLALGKSPEYMDKLYSKVAEQSKAYGPIYYASVFMTKGLEEMFINDPTAYKKLEGRCCFGTTSFFSRHRWHLSWENNDDLLGCIQGSFHIPFYCKRISSLKGIEVVDGAYGFAGTDLLHGDDTLYVGIDPHAEITRTFTYYEMFFPAVGEEYANMVQSGYDSMMKWDGTMIKKVGHRTPNYEALYVLWFLKAFEVLIFEGFALLLQSLSFFIFILKAPLVYLSAIHWRNNKNNNNNDNNNNNNNSNSSSNPYSGSALGDPLYGSFGGKTLRKPFRILWAQKFLTGEESS